MTDATRALLRSSPKTRTLTETAASGNKVARDRLARAYGRCTAAAMIAVSRPEQSVVAKRASKTSW